MNKLDKKGIGNSPPLPKQTKPVVAEDYNKLVDKISEVIDDLVEFNDVTTTTYTLVLSDLNKYIKVSNANPITVTVPALFEVGSVIALEQTDAGVITVAGDTDVTVNGNLSSGGQYTVLTLVKTSSTTWTCIGGV